MLFNDAGHQVDAVHSAARRARGRAVARPHINLPPNDRGNRDDRAIQRDYWMRPQAPDSGAGEAAATRSMAGMRLIVMVHPPVRREDPANREWPGKRKQAQLIQYSQSLDQSRVQAVEPIRLRAPQRPGRTGAENLRPADKRL